MSRRAEERGSCQALTIIKAPAGRKDVRVKRAFEVKEFSTETWPDFEALFGKHKGVAAAAGVHSTVVRRHNLTA